MQRVAAQFIRQYKSDPRHSFEQEVSRILDNATPWYRTLLNALFAYVCDIQQEWTRSGSVYLTSLSDYGNETSNSIPDIRSLETILAR